MFLGLRVKPTSKLSRGKPARTASRFDRILVTAFDPAYPAREHYVPDGVAPDDRFVWVFDSRETTREVSQETGPAPRGAQGPSVEGKQ